MMEPNKILKKINRFLNIKKCAGPISMQLEITNHCNFQCSMCPTHQKNSIVTRPKGYMSLQTYRSILSQFKELGGEFLIPQGAGESFLHKDIVEFISIAKSEFKFDIGFNTNGSILKEDHLRAIVDLQVNEIGFSVDALKEKTFFEITGRNVLSQVEENFLRLRDLRNSSSSHLPYLRVLLVEQKNNTDQIELYISKWKELADEIVIQTMRVGTGRKLTEKRQEKRRPCRHLFDTIFIQWDGDVTICCEDWLSQVIVGNIHRQTLKEIWNSKTLKLFREVQRKSIFTPPPICYDCEAWSGGKVRKILQNDLVIEKSALTTTVRKVSKNEG